MSDMKTNQEKAECWDVIEKEFNGTVGQTYRPQNVLRKKYENIKKRVKKKFADEKAHMRGTGGGPPKETKLTNLDSEVKELLGARVEGFQSQFDSDADLNSTARPSCIQSSTKEPSWDKEQLGTAVLGNLIPASNVEPDYIEASDEDCIEPPTNMLSETAQLRKEVEQSVGGSDTNVHNWSKYNPKMLKAKKSPALQVRKTGSTNKNGTVEKVCQWASAKAAVEENRQNLMAKEYNLKLRHMQEKHELELELMKLKASVEIKHLEEIHAEKMRILKSNNNSQSLNN